MIARYASDPAYTRGRLVGENHSAHRSAFQRDRDRIIHSTAFRRLKHKTQVFVEHEADHFRTRLTHSIEVGQVARTIAGVLNLNVELTEAIALAHDPVIPLSVARARMLLMNVWLLLVGSIIMLKPLRSSQIWSATRPISTV